MFSDKIKYVALLFIHVIFAVTLYAQNSTNEEENNGLKNNIQLLEKYFNSNEGWEASTIEWQNYVNSLIHFIDDVPIDEVLNKLQSVSEYSKIDFVTRMPGAVRDSLNVPGFYPYKEVLKDIEFAGVLLQKDYQQRKLTVPLELITNIEQKVNIIPQGKGMKLFNDSVFTFPNHLKKVDVVPDSLLQTTADFKRLVELDSLRMAYVEAKRKEYNDSLINAYRDSVITLYRQKQFNRELNERIYMIVNSARQNNLKVLQNYNDSIVSLVNDSINQSIRLLSAYANQIDTSKINFINLTGDEAKIVLKNDREKYTRLWLKNEQKDSLSITLKSLNKNTVQVLVDDGVTISRFTPKRTKDFDFRSFGNSNSSLDNVGKQYQMETPWIIGGDGTVAFTQAYLENWKKGGKSSLSLLLVLKGFANYSSPNSKIKWENFGEIRNGWIRPGGSESELQKNDDKFELISRFGVSAFKKWYYSAELNYNTQFFNGYRYPTSKNPDPISAFMGPARTFFKVGLDYKPNKDFSLFLSPLTIKNVFVKDTVRIDQTKFGVAADKRVFWEPGLNADLKFKTEITPTISFETKYKMFINYKEPFSKFDINWENLLVMQLTDYINMRMMVHFIYDDDVLFPILNDEGKQIGQEPKLQINQFISVGFTYKINHKVIRSKKLR